MTQIWKYDYESRCDCSDDDNCGCSSPGNMGRSYVVENTIGDKTAVCGVGSQAVNFNAPAVLADGTVCENFNFFEFITGNYALLIFYLADFSAICPAEITAFNQAYEQIAKYGVKLAAVSVDALPAHVAWRKTAIVDGGIGQVHFPLISDVNKKICASYGVLRSDGMAQRASFLIDKSFNVSYQAVYDKEIERNVGEIIRIIDKLNTLEEAERFGLKCLLQAKNDDFVAQC